jgi:hypothetical protein
VFLILHHFSSVSSTNKTEHNDLTEILLKEALNTTGLSLTPCVLHKNKHVFSDSLFSGTHGNIRQVCTCITDHINTLVLAIDYNDQYILKQTHVIPSPTGTH